MNIVSYNIFLVTPSGSTITTQQYITWFLVVLGWVVTCILAWVILRKNARNSWIGDIKKMLISLEDNSIEFWMSDNEEKESIELKKLGREIKEITTLAQEIQVYGGQRYSNDLFKKLRQAVTTEIYDNDKLKRNLKVLDNRINNISDACSQLRNLYSRK